MLNELRAKKVAAPIAREYIKAATKKRLVTT